MKLYDFSIYAKRRDAQKAAHAVLAAAEKLAEPGAVIELKMKVNDWFMLHQEVLEKEAS